MKNVWWMLVLALAAPLTACDRPEQERIEEGVREGEQDVERDLRTGGEELREEGREIRERATEDLRREREAIDRDEIEGIERREQALGAEEERRERDLRRMEAEGQEAR